MAKRNPTPVPDTAESCRCECGRPVQLTGTVTDTDVPDWVCECRRFGIVLPAYYQERHPDEPPVMVCGRKRQAHLPVAA